MELGIQLVDDKQASFFQCVVERDRHAHHLARSGGFLVEAEFVGVPVHDMANPDAPVLEVILIALDSEAVNGYSGCFEDADDDVFVLLLKHLLKDELFKAEVEVDEPRRGDPLCGHINELDVIVQRKERKIGDIEVERRIGSGALEHGPNSTSSLSSRIP